MSWRDYADVYPGDGHTVVGTVKVWQDLHSEELGNRRDVFVYLPPSTRRFATRAPVIYMHDGQNVFDEATSYAGEVRADETLEALSGEGLEAIVVAVANGGTARGPEYNGFDDQRHGRGRGDAYLRFLVETVKPLVDASFPTLTDRASSGLMGSSFGAAISLFGFFRHPDVFGFAGAMSIAGWWGRHALRRYIADAPHVPGRLYVDIGTREEGRSLGDRLALHIPSRRILHDARRYRDVLLGKGYVEGVDLLYVEDEDGVHNERAWARRLPDALRFLLGPIKVRPGRPEPRSSEAALP